MQHLFKITLFTDVAIKDSFNVLNIQINSKNKINVLIISITCQANLIFV